MSITNLLNRGRYITKIDNIYYDVTDFIKYHPGGEVIKGVCNGNDGTAMFKSSHFNLPNIEDIKLIKKINISDNQSISKYEFNSDENCFYNDLKRDIQYYFKQRNIDYSIPSLSSRIVFMINILLFFLCLYGSYFQGYLIYSVLMGLLSWNFAGTLVHDHGAHRINVKKNNKIGSFIMTCLNSITFPGALETHFIFSHYGHHSSIHDKELDSDNHLIYPLVRWSPHWKKLWFHKYQHLYWPLGYAIYLYFYFSKAYSSDENINWWRKHNHAYRARYNFKFKLLYFIMFMHILVPLYNLGFLGLLNTMIFFAVYSAGGLFFATVNHLVSQNPFDTPEHVDKNQWAYNVVATSADYLINDPLATYLSGGFNLHGLHHLFPSIHPSHLASIYHIYEEKCKQYSYPYILINSWTDLFQRYINYLYVLGN